MAGMTTALKYLAGYPPALLAQVQAAIAAGTLRSSLQQRYPDGHTVRGDRALSDYVGDAEGAPPAQCAAAGAR